jgi:hypothetical protein
LIYEIVFAALATAKQPANTSLRVIPNPAAFSKRVRNLLFN